MPKNFHKKRRQTSYATTNSYQELEDRKMMATFMVSNLGDGVVSAAGDLPGSLRQAIFDANENPGADSIEFAGDALTGTITLVEGELQVTESVDIVGPGAADLTVSGDDTTGIFWFGDDSGASTFNVSGLTLTGGNGETDAGLPNSFGGAVLFFDQFGGDDTLNISDSAIVDNTAVRGGGLHAVLGTLNITDTTISGNSSTRVSGATGGGGLSLEQVDTTLERVFVDNNTSNRPGGGIVSYVESGTQNDGDANLTIIDSSITNNNAAQGGGINNETGSGSFDAKLTLVGTTVSGNETTSSGGGIRDSAGVITISNSLIADNVANNVGGGILTTNTDLSIFNSTVSGNRGVDSSGGALRIFGNRSLDPAGTGESITQIVNSTVAFNESGFNGAISGEAQANSSVTIGFQNSIFSDNTGSPNFGSFFSGTTFVSAGHNISDDNSGDLVATGDQPNTNPLLLPLADNGGLTRTHALRLESPAIDAGSNALAVDADGNALATDQRGTGFDRILDGTVDVGAFESEFFQGDLIVSSATDIVDNDFSSGQLSLREAVLIANARDGVDTITFDAALNGQTITLTDDALTGELQVTESVDIVGPGAAELTISGADTTGIFWFGDESGASTFNVSGLTLTGGNGETDAGLPNSFGGAVLFFDQFGGDDTLNISDSAIVDNTAVRGGGLHAVLGTLNITDTTISGNSSTRVSGATGGGGLSLEQVDTTLERVFVDNNTSNRPGGGIVSYVESGTQNDGDANLTIIDSSITNNNAAQGGGINNETGSGSFDAKLTLVGTTVSGNETTSSGGGIRDSAGVITISNSLIADNVANNVGGGILTTNTDLSIFNSTVSGNRGVDSSGGALRIFGNRSLDPAGTGESITQIVNSTVAFNESGFNGAISGEAQANSSVTIGFQNSIFSDNTGSPNFGSFFSGTTFVSAGHNISDDNSGDLVATGDQPNTNPLLLPLADNGGLTRTHALRLESPAIDAGSNALAVDADGNALATDQRGTGFDRILDGTVDVGAFESEFFQGDLIVSSATDIVDNDFSSGQLSLREAVLIANARDGVDTITFDAALNGQTITLTDDALTGELQVTESVDIVGPGAAELTISGADTTGIFWFGDESGASTFNVSGLTLTGGNGETDAGLPNSFGGAVLFFDQFGGDDTLNISDSAIVDNTAVRGGGLHAVLGTLNITDTTISGNSSTRVSGATGGGGLSLEQVDTTLERVFVDNNTSNRPGGGIVSYVESGTQNDGDANLTIIDSSITNNNAAQGGGINNETGSGSFDAKLTLVGTTVSGNTTSSSGAGIRDSAGVITISNSLIADNVANNVGGGILTTNTDLSIFNSTVSGNRGVDSSGGALRIFGDRSLDPAGTGESITQIVNSTVAFNESGFNGAISGEAQANSLVTIGFQNSIFSDNAGSPNFGSFGSGTTFVSAGHNISDDNSGNLFAIGDRINTDPLLLELLDNGGLTRTHALEIGSPAINAGNNALAVDAEGNPLATDQRGEGFERIVDGTPATVDIGAFENVPFEGELVVSNTSDVVDGLIGEGQLSLREAIQIANDRDGFDSITFAPDVRGTITLTGSELEVTDSIEIVGPGAGLLTLDANNDSRVFNFGDVLAASEFSVSGLTLTNGDARNGGGIEDHGGAILFFDSFGQGGEDSLQISNVVINNSSAAVGGGLRSVLGSLDISNTTFSNNEATGNVNGFSGGGLALQQSDTELRDVTVTGNTAQQRGGGIVNFVGVDTPTIGDSNLTIINGTITDNSANIGGGIHNETRTNLAEAFLSVASTSISANQTSSSGAGIQSDAGTVAITSSLISDNIGGLAGAGIFARNASLEVSNSTISGNRSANNTGGAIRLFASIGTDPDGTGQSVTEIQSSTIAFNTSGGTGAITGEALGNSSVVVRSQNSIFANNSGSPNFGSFTSGSGVTAFVSEGHNLSDDGTGNLTAVGDLSNTDPLLAPLADNGGPTLTHSPVLGSPAIDAGNSTFATDQRGLDRPFDFDVIPNASTSNGSDIGAVEVLPAEASSLVVTTDLDVVNAFDQLTSIREAIAFADSTAGEDTITFDGSLAGSVVELDSQTGGGLLINDSLVIDASTLSNPLTIVGNGSNRVVDFRASTGDLTIDGLTITGGVANDGAGILFQSDGLLTVRNSTISDNSSADDGGGIHVNGGSLIVHNTSVVGNLAQDFAGGIFVSSGDFTMTESTVSNNIALNGFGGGLQLEFLTATITSSTIDGNSTPNAGGGGINSPFSDLTVINTTISGNTSGGLRFGGGGILSAPTVSERTTLINSTIVQNESAVGAGGIFTGTPLTVENSIIADNTLNGVSSDIATDQVFSNQLTINHSLIGNADGLGTINGNVGNLFGTEANPLDPMLGELADNGGPTLTHALLPGSPAINAGSNDLAVDSNGNPLLFDQRGEGFDRILDGTVDIGATEVQADVSNAPGIESIVIQDGSEQRSVIRGITVTFDSIVNVADGAFELTNEAGQAVDIAVALSQVGNQTIATLTFSGALTDSTGSLVDGQYSLRTIDDLITDNAGNTADSNGDGTSGNDRLDDFFRLYGDADGDGSVGFFDYALFRNALFSQEGDDEFDIAFDANGDGVIDLLDIQDFRDNFGATI